MALPILRSSDLPVRRTDDIRDTSLTTFNPWREFEQMNRWFDEFMGRSFGLRPFGPAATAPGSPSVEMYESPDEIRVFAYVPGAKADGFDISVTGNMLQIRGEHQQWIEGDHWNCYGSGVARSQGTFEARYNLPVEVDANQVSAKYHDGILELHLPKAEKAKVKTVKVNVESPAPARIESGG